MKLFKAILLLVAIAAQVGVNLQALGNLYKLPKDECPHKTRHVAAHPRDTAHSGYPATNE